MASKRSLLLRLSPELWEEIKRWADDDLRSVNAQIEYILREEVRRQRRRLLDENADENSGRDS
jgi:hypothetical protein